MTDEIAALTAEIEALRAQVATMIAMSDTGGADGWRPPRGVSPLIDRALDVREARDAERKRADAIKIEAERHRRIADEAVTRIESAEAERAAVVAWLRAGVHHHRGFGFHLIGDELGAYADVIERGEHRREGAE